MAVVLVVEDEVQIRDCIKLYLEMLGHDVITASDADEARVALEAASADCLVTDLNIPGTRGCELVDEAKAGHPEIPIVVITGYDDIRRCAESAEPDVILHKPFDLDDLASCIDRLVSQHDH